jgi:competence protein ComFC
MGYKLEGNWAAGVAFDLHALKGKYLGQDQYNNSSSEMGELVSQLKYKHDWSVVNKIVDLLQTVKGLDKMDAIIPIPPSNGDRSNQPVFSIATEMGNRFNIKVYLDAFDISSRGQKLKGIDDPEKRQEALRCSMHIAKNYNLSRKNILLIDVLYRSGSALMIATKLLYDKATANNVYVLTMIKASSKR